MTFPKPVDQVWVGRPGAYDVVEVDIPHLGAPVPNISYGPLVHATNMPYQVPHSPIRARWDRSVEFCPRCCGRQEPSFPLKLVNMFGNLQSSIFNSVCELSNGGGIKTNLPTCFFLVNARWASTMRSSGNVFASRGRISPFSI